MSSQTELKNLNLKIFYLKCKDTVLKYVYVDIILKYVYAWEFTNKEVAATETLCYKLWLFLMLNVYMFLSYWSINLNLSLRFVSSNHWFHLFPFPECWEFIHAKHFLWNKREILSSKWMSVLRWYRMSVDINVDKTKLQSKYFHNFTIS